VDIGLPLFWLESVGKNNPNTLGFHLPKVEYRESAPLADRDEGMAIFRHDDDRGGSEILKMRVKRGKNRQKSGTVVRAVGKGLEFLNV
jgi:hypothetical protein